MKKIAEGLIEQIEFYGLQEKLVKKYGLSYESFKDHFYYSIRHQEYFYENVAGISEVIKEHVR